VQRSHHWHHLLDFSCQCHHRWWRWCRYVELTADNVPEWKLSHNLHRRGWGSAFDAPSREDGWWAEAK
jgi:hypothetical protein